MRRAAVTGGVGLVTHPFTPAVEELHVMDASMLGGDLCQHEQVGGRGKSGMSRLHAHRARPGCLRG
jgi:hypothetical protein